MDRRDFLMTGVAAAPVLWGFPRRRVRPAPFVLTTADLESHVVAVRLRDGRILRRIGTREGPRSIERNAAGPAVVAHSTEGVVTLLDPDTLRVRRVLGGFSEPRYTAIAHGGTVAYVTDSGAGEVAVIDLVRGRVVRRVEVGAGARHLARDPDATRLWIPLGSSAAEIAVVDISDRWRPRPLRRVRPPFLAHDVGFAPGGRRIWVTAGREGVVAVYERGGGSPVRTLRADAAPQHVGFGAHFAFVASGNGGTLRMHALSDSRSRRAFSVPIGSFNVQAGAGHAVSPSLGGGHLTVVDSAGRVLHQRSVADAAHDACIVA